MSVIVFLLKIAWAAFVITTPVLGVWAASSLAAYLNKPMWTVVLCGLALFPLLPVAWELFAIWRRDRRDQKRRDKAALGGFPFESRPRYLKTIDRMILRTLFVNLAFLTGLLAFYPQQGFEAVSTRGDWMLDGRSDATAEKVRARIFWTAEKLSWLYDYFHGNPFRDFGSDEPEIPEDPTPTPAEPAEPDKPDKPDKPDDSGDDGGKTPDTAKRPDERKKRWPLPETLHPAVTAIPKDRESSIQSVATYLAEKEKDPLLLVKALHDYVADRIAYDAPAYVEGRYPPQDAETVFKRRLGVCAGYAKLLTALGRVAGAKIVYLVGDARTEGWDLSGEGHAWNAAEIEGKWYLIDATWNSGAVSGKTFTKGYGTQYLFTPPEVFGITHYPDEAKWQLRAKPLSRGEFMRQPVLSPIFYASGLALIAPNRSQVTVRNAIAIEIRNPLGKYMLASWSPVNSSERGQRCEVTGRSQLRVNCTFPSEGRYDVKLFANDEEYGTFGYAGSLGVNSDP